jgi:fumarate hydratase class II
MKTRSVHDSMGELQVPADALYGAQTQRAIENFPISGLHVPRAFIRALGLIKSACAQVNSELGYLEADKAKAIQTASQKVIDGEVDDQFPVDIFQTGSGTSTNMNANEVIATLASNESGLQIHPNDHVNMGQSSNDTIPTAIHVSATLMLHEQLLPALKHLSETIKTKAKSIKHITKTGRTHLMDAMPIRFDQELGGWARQIDQNIARVEAVLPRISLLAQGGTAVGTGINADKKMGEMVAKTIAKETGFKFATSPNYFESLSCQDTAVELSGALNTLSVSLMKIANDLRWKNSGPLAGLSEIQLTALQPGSSIMPGKINPVIPEAVCMVCAQVMGNHTTITVGGQAGNFQLNVMLPVIAYNLLQSIHILSTSMTDLADKAIKDFTVLEENVSKALELNPILVTALNPVIGYEKGAAIAKQAYKEKRPVKDVTRENTDLSEIEINEYLDATKLTEGGIHS